MAYSVMLQPFSGALLSIEVARFLDKKDAQDFVHQRCSGGDVPGLVLGEFRPTALFLREAAAPSDAVVVAVEKGRVEGPFLVDNGELFPLRLSMAERAGESCVILEAPRYNLEAPVDTGTLEQVQALLRAWWDLNRPDIEGE